MSLVYASSINKDFCLWSPEKQRQKCRQKTKNLAPGTKAIPGNMLYPRDKRRMKILRMTEWIISFFGIWWFDEKNHVWELQWALKVTRKGLLQLLFFVALYFQFKDEIPRKNTVKFSSQFTTVRCFFLLGEMPPIWMEPCWYLFLSFTPERCAFRISSSLSICGPRWKLFLEYRIPTKIFTTVSCTVDYTNDVYNVHIIYVNDTSNFVDALYLL